MKKQFIAVLLVFTLLMSLSACMSADAVQTLEIVEDKVESRLEAAKNKLEESLRNAAASSSAPAPAAEPTAPAPEPKAEPAAPAVPAPENRQRLSEDQALQIALDYVGFAADQVSRVRVEFEVDDGIPQYDVEFLQGDWEYEFEIHAENGKIHSYDKDHKND